MILWCVLNFFPIGFAQLLAVYTHSYVYARSLQFYNTTLLWQWLRMPGDIAFGAGGVVIAWDFIKKVSIAHKIYLSTQRAETTHGKTLS
jgi:nitric oxide reductase subunit B